MNIFTKIFSGGASKLIDSLGNAGDKLFTSDEQRLEAEAKLQTVLLEMEKEANSLLKGQQELIKLDIQSGNIFQSGWRPMIGWAGAFAMIYNFVFHPIASVYIELPPTLGNELYPIVTGMLGIGAYRTYEKVKK